MSFREGGISARDGARLYFRDYGPRLSDRTTVVCLPGLTRNSADFHLAAARLCRDRRVVCPDYRGRGRSDRDPDWRHYGPRSVLGDVGDLLTALDLGPVVVIGTSFGGLLAMALAVARPTALSAVALNDVGPELDGNGLDRIRDYVGKDRPHRDWDEAIHDIKTLFPNMSAPEPAEEGWRRLAENTWRRGEDGLLHLDFDPRLVRTLETPDRLPDLWRLFAALRRFPLACIRGEVSDVLSSESFDRMRRSRPDMIAATIEGVGHAPYLGEPAACAALDALLSASDDGRR